MHVRYLNRCRSYTDVYLRFTLGLPCHLRITEQLETSVDLTIHYWPICGKKFDKRKYLTTLPKPFYGTLLLFVKYEVCN